MTNKLEPIVLQKQREVALLHKQLRENAQHPLARLLQGELPNKKTPSFKQALSGDSLAVIAEIKRKSPSKGMLAQIADPIELASRYLAGGASALSILTDEQFFGGHIHDLASVAATVNKHSLPILRKDFIIDPIQIAEAANAGASAILCIVAILGKKVKPLIAYAHSIQLDVLVEVHTQAELDIALECGADIIGINNRNLNTFEIDTSLALQMIESIPDHIIKVAESGITHPALAQKYYQAGFNAVLIGEALVKSADPEQFIRECRHA